MLIPLKQWICDSCGEIINSAEDGWVEWLSGKETFDSEYGFKIVHNNGSSPLGKGGCFHYREEECPSDLPLTHFMGDKGYVLLLSFLDWGPYVKPEYEGPRVKDLREFIEFMRRLTVPYYEEARMFFKEALADGDLDPSSVDMIYDPEDLKRIVEKYGEG